MTMFGFSRKKLEMPTQETALEGRDMPIPTAETHFVLGTALKAPFPQGFEQAMIGMGCFWGAERIFWQLDGVYTTAVGYSGGITPNATYEEVCSGKTGHNEVVVVVFDPTIIPYRTLLTLFWEHHDPTQGMRQGNDIGTQYRSGIYTYSDAQAVEAKASQAAYQSALAARNYGPITSEITSAGPFYYAEAHHQQYLAKNPDGYCGLGGTGVSCPVPHS
ncbi:peptide-methionine (S)-S-oxide reductase MsrA [Cohaesibacter celericrescens]|uniref:peptide-methionine (S)-S-oxide reductase MsrA n=1 Tax=Cohaesibacter celericrescens TaxID=2067669 RepID=UPI00356AFE42